MHNIKVKFDKTIPFDGNTMFKEISDDYIGLFYVYLEYFYNGYNKHKPIYIGSSIKAKNIKYAIANFLEDYEDKIKEHIEKFINDKKIKKKNTELLISLAKINNIKELRMVEEVAIYKNKDLLLNENIPTDLSYNDMEIEILDINNSSDNSETLGLKNNISIKI